MTKLTITVNGRYALALRDKVLPEESIFYNGLPWKEYRTHGSYWFVEFRAGDTIEVKDTVIDYCTKVSDLSVHSVEPVHRNGFDDLIEALQIFKKYNEENEDRPTQCAHDELQVKGRKDVSPEDAKRLEELGFKWSDASHSWYSFRFGAG